MAKLIGTGGGSSKLVNSKTPKIEPKSRAIRPGAADMIGESTAFKKPNLDAGRGYSTPQGPTSLIQSGPGAGRKIFDCGTQQSPKAPRPMTPTKDTLAGE